MAVSESSSFHRVSSKPFCMSEKQLEVANEILHKVESQVGKKLDEKSFESIFKQNTDQSFESTFEDAAIFLLTNSYQITPITFHNLIRLIRKKGKDTLYLSFILSNTDSKTTTGQEIKNAHFYSAIISHGTKGSQFYLTAKKAFEEAQKTGKANDYVYSSFMYVAKKRGQLDDALKVFKEAKSHLNKVINNIGIDIVLEADKEDEAKDIFNNELLPTLKYSSDEVDLHELSLGAAKCYIDHILSISEKNQKIRIITGKGIHSKSSELFVMRNQCRDYLAKRSSICKIIKVSEGYIDIEICK